MKLRELFDFENKKTFIKYRIVADIIKLKTIVLLRSIDIVKFTHSLNEYWLRSKYKLDSLVTDSKPCVDLGIYQSNEFRHVRDKGKIKHPVVKKFFKNQISEIKKVGKFEYIISLKLN